MSLILLPDDMRFIEDIVNKTFPEYQGLISLEDNEQGQTYVICHKTSILSKKTGEVVSSDIEELYIHWFEFVITRLLPKLYKNNPRLLDNAYDMWSDLFMGKIDLVWLLDYYNTLIIPSSKKL